MFENRSTLDYEAKINLEDKHRCHKHHVDLGLIASTIAFRYINKYLSP